MAADLTPYLHQENAARQQFGAQSAANTFAQTLSQRRGSRGLADYRRGFERSLPNYTAQFGRRGMWGGNQSGVMRRAMQNYVGDHTRNLGYMQQDLFDNNQQFDFNQARFTAERDQALANIAAQKAATIANTASQIAALRPYMG